MKIAIVDDNEVISLEVQEQLQKLLLGNNFEICIFDSGDRYVASNYVADYLFLDIEMPGLDGISVKNINETSGNNTKIVFLTGIESRMREAFGRNVIGFLSKPLDICELEKIVNKFEIPIEDQFLEFVINNRNYVIPISNVLFIEASDKYTFLYTKADEKLCIRKTMKEWTDELPDLLFCRINKSYIINYVLCEKSITNIQLPNNKYTTVSRIHRDRLKKGYARYLRDRMGK